MKQKWFTIIFRNPQESVHVGNARQNAVGDYIAWDNKSTMTEAYGAARKLAGKCQEVFLFVGKEPGRLAARFLDGVDSPL